MNSIYIYDGSFQKGDAGFFMIRGAAARHCLESGIPFDAARAKIVRDEKGKPYFEDYPLEFSLTHSGSLWMCMFSSQPCGLDLQVIRDCDHEKISARYYKPEEQKYVEENGLEGFFDVWVRKEAYCKMTGEGLFGADMPSVLADSGVFAGKEYHFQDVEIADDMRCAVCTGPEAEIELRVLA